CIDVKDTACVDACPVDCIHTTEGEKQLYINPAECIDCGACEPACPVSAIFMVDEVPAEWNFFVELNRKFFETFVKPKSADEAAGTAEGKKSKKQEDKIGIEEFVQSLETPQSAIRAPLRPLVMLSQPLLGAFSAKFKSELEEMAANPKVFSAAISTGINSLINLALYPLLFFLFAIRGDGINLFSGKGNLFIFLGVALAIAEGLYRFKDELVATTSDEKPKYGAALYGWILSFVAYPLLSALRPVIATKPAKFRSTLPGAVLTDGPIYADDVRERYRRYGMINRVKESVDRYILEIEFPHWVPNCEYKTKYNLPDLMPDYTCQVNLEGNTVVVEARLEDARFAEVVGRSSSFPHGFRNVFQIEGQPENVRATYRDKLLEVIVPKSGKVEDLVIERKVHYAKIKG
ncbi:4Fe-4S binding protein, partial [Candidatus Poribacteria bacterium]|nr:4Fe-4S binding protein [Candidatus Poribacteria bacterium]